MGVLAPLHSLTAEFQHWSMPPSSQPGATGSKLTAGGLRLRANGGITLHGVPPPHTPAKRSYGAADRKRWGLGDVAGRDRWFGHCWEVEVPYHAQ